MTDKELLDEIQEMEDGLVRFATGGGYEEPEYQRVRKLVLADPRTKALLPEFLRTNRTLAQFWPFIKNQFAHYAERRQFIWAGFGPLHDQLEGRDAAPADENVSEVLSAFDVENVHSMWQKALGRRREDPEGAITAARTLLESVCKHILDDLRTPYKDSNDLPILYKAVAHELQLAPSQHTEDVFKQILGGCTSVVEGLGAMRNKLSDSHGKGAQRVKPATRHAELAVNLAGSMATFLVQTWQQRKIATKTDKQRAGS